MNKEDDIMFLIQAIIRPEKMAEVYKNITKRQDEELKAGLPLEKYEAFVALQKDGVSKTLKKNKKKKKEKRKKSKN